MAGSYWGDKISHDWLVTAFYSPPLVAAVKAVASTGEQIMPPVCMASYATASICKTDPVRTRWAATVERAERAPRV